MSSNDRERAVQVEMLVNVVVDALDSELLDRLGERPSTIAGIVRDEVQSNLESVPYVRDVSVVILK